AVAVCPSIVARCITGGRCHVPVGASAAGSLATCVGTDLASSTGMIGLGPSHTLCSPFVALCLVATAPGVASAARADERVIVPAPVQGESAAPPQRTSGEGAEAKGAAPAGEAPAGQREAESAPSASQPPAEEDPGLRDVDASGRLASGPTATELRDVDASPQGAGAQGTAAGEWETLEAPPRPSEPAAAAPSEPPPPRVEARPSRPELSPEERALRKRQRAGAAMLGAGLGAFALVYLGSAFYGAAVFDRREGQFLDAEGSTGFASDDQRRAYGRRMMIPIGGPFAAAAVAPSATEALLTSLAGVAQVATLSVGVAGAVIYGKARRRQPRERLVVSGAPVAGGGVVAVQGRF
ncbi:MAG: hypothetical protein D6705_03615, partial [Deltaproteobacteria bacterium]